MIQKLFSEEKHEPKAEKPKEEVVKVVPYGLKDGMVYCARIKGKIYFIGDLKHCEQEDIFYNVRIMAKMLEGKKSSIHKNYQKEDGVDYREAYTMPEFEKEADTYNEDIYLFENGEMKLVRKWVEKKEKNWLDMRDREKDENGIIKLSDEEILDFPITTLRCWKFNKFGTDCYTNDKGESDYCCPACPCSEECHSGKQTPLEKRYFQLKPNKNTLASFS